MFFPERCIGHLLKHSEHGPIVHVVSVDHGVPAFRGAVPLKENAAGCAPFPFIGAPQVVFGVLGAALQNRVVHAGSGDGDPPLDIRVFRLQGREVYNGFRLLFLAGLFIPSRFLPGAFGSGEGVYCVFIF